MSYLKTDLEGKVRNLPHFKSEALLPLFEAVVNSIQAIEERGNFASGVIDIRILREEQIMLGDLDSAAICGFEITDNGIGFNTENFDSFETSDTTHKQAKGGKGIGRFLWLKAFDTVSVDSIFESDGKRYKRQFTFTPNAGITQSPVTETFADLQTTVRLLGFKKDYRKLASAYKTPQKIAQRILEHCLSYFIASDAPLITVRDLDDTLVLNTIFESEIKNNTKLETVEIGQQVFSLAHIKLYSTHDKMHNIVLCANRRDVKTLSLSKALGTSTQFDDVDQKFVYALYVTSPYLDQNVDTYRLNFEIPDDATLLDQSNGITMSMIENAVSAAAKVFLADFLKKAKEKKVYLIANHLATVNPSLRAVPHYCPEVYDDIEPNSSPEKINEVLYCHKGKAEWAISQKSDKLLKTQAKSLSEVDESYKALTSEISAFQKDNLVNYLCDRKRMIALLEKKLELNADGKFSNEDIIHDLVFPRKATTDELAFENHNLWLIDECLTFHAFAASEMPLSETTTSESEERPDIVAFAEVDEDKIARSVSILEFKKPQRTSFDEDPTRQLYRYLREIKETKRVRLPNGRDLNVGDTTRYYCYAICDITPAIHVFAENNGNYARLKGELGYYMYNRALNAHTEILHFDKLVVDAKRRHKAFFEKLGIG